MNIGTCITFLWWIWYRWHGLWYVLCDIILSWVQEYKILYNRWSSMWYIVDVETFLRTLPDLMWYTVGVAHFWKLLFNVVHRWCNTFLKEIQRDTSLMWHVSGFNVIHNCDTFWRVLSDLRETSVMLHICERFVV